ncbi:MAG TPA: ROK family protein [Armatimonadota bacterium]|nr:ROK family protein [Armatimonadota bacterium]
MTSFLGLDVGNTRLTAALVSEQGRILGIARRDTPPDAADAVAALVELADGLEGAAGAAGAGIGFGGPVDVAAGRVRGSFLTRGWGGLALGEMVAERLGVPTWLANDADAGGLAEALFGAGRAAGIVLYVNVGTGIGGAVIVDGRIHVGASSTAGEIGHVLADSGGPRCACGHWGCLQEVASGRALARSARERLARGEASTGPLARMGPDEITGRAVGQAAAAGDALARAAVDEAARHLGIALANAVNVLDPHLVVVGGGVAGLGETLLGPVREAYCAQVLAPERQAAIVPAELGYDAGVIGAAALAMTEQGARSGR